jgi:hypothetical protein
MIGQPSRVARKLFARSSVSHSDRPGGAIGYALIEEALPLGHSVFVCSRKELTPMRTLVPLALLVLLLTVVVGCQGDPKGHTLPDIDPPVARTESKELEMHGDVRTDEYYWLNQRENPEVLAYLEAENGYTSAMMAHTADLQRTLFREFKERIKQTDESVPYRRGDYFYYSRVEEGKDYPIYARKNESLQAAEEVLLDVNELAAGHDGYYRAGGLDLSHDHNLLAFGVDKVGRRIYTIQVKNLSTGEMLPDVIPDVTANITWANDNKTFFYARQDPTTLRRYQILRHTLGSDPSTDVLVHRLLTDDGRRVPLHRCQQAFIRIQGLAEETARPRVRRGSLRRSLLHPHQRPGQELPPDEDAGQQDRDGQLDGGDRAPRRRLPAELRDLQGLPGRDRAQGRPARVTSDALGWQRRALPRLR